MSDSIKANTNPVMQPLRIACIGGSLTFGLGLPNRRQECYPAVLQDLLDNQLGAGRVMVKNFGYSGATASRESNEPFWETPSFTSANRFRPHLVLIMLGTNDAQFANAAGRVNLARDLRDLIEHFETSSTSYETLGWSRPRVLISQFPPAVPPVAAIDFVALAQVVRPTIDQVGQETGVEVMDFLTPIEASRENFPDGLHPISEVAAQIAQIAFEAVLPQITDTTP